MTDLSMIGKPSHIYANQADHYTIMLSCKSLTLKFAKRSTANNWRHRKKIKPNNFLYTNYNLNGHIPKRICRKSPYNYVSKIQSGAINARLNFFKFKCFHIIESQNNTRDVT